MRKSPIHASYILAAGLATLAWVAVSAPVPAAVMASRVSSTERAPLTAMAHDADPHALLSVADALGTKLDVAVPAGATRLVIEPGSDDADGEFGWVSAFDAQGRELLRQKETLGVVFRLEERGVLVGTLGERSDAPVELKVPAGAVRLHVISQNYDQDSNARKDGHLVAYDARGAVVADEANLAIDILTP